MNDAYADAIALSDEQLERLADLLATKLIAMRPAGPPMLTVEDISTMFKVSRAWVYENAARLGGVKLGPGERAPLRFDVERVVAALQPMAAPAPRQLGSAHPAPAMPRRRRPKRLHPVYYG
jgi:hypothetical protein